MNLVLLASLGIAGVAVLVGAVFALFETTHIRRMERAIQQETRETLSAVS